jgi:hypothetical protein
MSAGFANLPGTINDVRLHQLGIIQDHCPTGNSISALEVY